MSAPPSAVVLDHTALLALGAGHRLLSARIDAAHRGDGGPVYVPLVCLAAATAARPGLDEHLGALPAIEFVELGFAGAAAVGRLVAGGVDWQTAHAVHAGRPDPEWPAGRPVVTDQPETYAKLGVSTMLFPPESAA